MSMATPGSSNFDAGVNYNSFQDKHTTKKRRNPIVMRVNTNSYAPELFFERD